MAREASVKNLTNAKRSKNDEFYTRYIDIQKEIEKYLDYNPNTFRNKVVYCNCDDPFESNFFRYFVLNFNKLGLKRLITTSYKPSPVANTQLGLFGDDKTLKKEKGRSKITANKFIINEVKDMDSDGEFNLKDVAKQLKANKNNEWTPLHGDGDFRSDECVALLKQSDIVVTNPPFSLFREYVKQLCEHEKKFLIIGNINCITYKEIFPQVYLFPVRDKSNAYLVQNVVLIALKSQTIVSFENDNPELNEYLNHLWKKDVQRDVSILTDDYAPVDWYMKDLI